MQKILFLLMIIFVLIGNIKAQEINNILLPDSGMLPAWDIQVICTAPTGCNPPYKVTAFLDGGTSRFWYTNSSGYVVANMNGMPDYDSEGNLFRYYIVVTPKGSDMPCGITDALYPTGSVYLEIEIRQGPCNMK